MMFDRFIEQQLTLCLHPLSSFACHEEQDSLSTICRRFFLLLFLNRVDVFDYTPTDELSNESIVCLRCCQRNFAILPTSVSGQETDQSSLLVRHCRDHQRGISSQ